MKTTIRLRLTLVHVLLFAVTAMLLVVGTYFLTARSTPPESAGPRSRVEEQLHLPAGTLSAGRPNAPELLPPRALRRTMLREVASGVQGQTRSELLTRLVIFSVGLLLVMTVVSFGLAWIVAGRTLRPLRRITERAKSASETNLHEPIALEGPHDELRELADTFDGMLARLDASFAGQRLFVANASHELRTPLTRIRAKLDVTLAQPDVGPRELEEMGRTIRSAVDRSSRLIDALLTLATARGELHLEPVPIDEITRVVLAELEPAAAERGVVLTSALSAREVMGDRILLEQLVRNLIENAIKHNVSGGWAAVDVHPRGDGVVTLRVANGGAFLRDDSVDDLFAPLRRGHGERIHSDDGFGLGLAIVKAVADAHGASVAAKPLPEGGLSIDVVMPCVPVAPRPMERIATSTR